MALKGLRLQSDADIKLSPISYTVHSQTPAYLSTIVLMSRAPQMTPQMTTQRDVNAYVGGNWETVSNTNRPRHLSPLHLSIGTTRPARVPLPSHAYTLIPNTHDTRL